jgi:hypothetical protein
MPEITGSDFAQLVGTQLENDKPVVFPDRPVGSFVLKILPGQEDSPLVDARVNFSGVDPNTKKQIFGYFDATETPLEETLRLLNPADLN